MDEALAHLSPVTSQVQGLIDFVGSHPHFALIAIFLLALSEAVPVVGTVVPGSTAILGISALATTAQLDPWLLLIAATLGAIAGDGFSFWLGRRYRAKILRAWLNRSPQLTARSMAFIKRYGISSVFLARFTAVVRAFVPMLAGVLLAMAVSVAGAKAERLFFVVFAMALLGMGAWHLLSAKSRDTAVAPIKPLRMLALRENSPDRG